MCDYSLAEISNRLAVEGEELVVHRFPTGSVGLASLIDLCASDRAKARKKRSFWSGIKSFFESPLASVPAICVPPGAVLIGKTFPRDLLRMWDLAAEEKELSLRFVQTSAEVNRYRDALQLPTGREVLLQDLPAGLRLQLISFGGGVDRELEQDAPHRVFAG